MYTPAGPWFLFFQNSTTKLGFSMPTITYILIMSGSSRPSSHSSLSYLFSCLSSETQKHMRQNKNNCGSSRLERSRKFSMFQKRATIGTNKCSWFLYNSDRKQHLGEKPLDFEEQMSIKVYTTRGLVQIRNFVIWKGILEINSYNQIIFSVTNSETISNHRLITVIIALLARIQ